MSSESHPLARRIGYARVSGPGQDLARQLRHLEAQSCTRVYSDKASGKSLANRPQLEAALSSLIEGDQLVIAEWDRATRSMWDGLHIIKRVIEAKASLIVLDRPYIDLTTPMGQGFIALFSALAEDERGRILKRTREGRREAIERGKKMGRKPKLTPYQVQEVRQRVEAGEHMRDLAKSYKVGRSTIYRACR